MHFEAGGCLAGQRGACDAATTDGTSPRTVRHGNLPRLAQANVFCARLSHAICFHYCYDSAATIMVEQSSFRGRCRW